MTALPAPWPTLFTIGLVVVVVYAAVQLIKLEKAERAEREANRRRALGNRGFAR